MELHYLKTDGSIPEVILKMFVTHTTHGIIGTSN